MEYNCPECSNVLSFDISQIELVLLRIKCGSCGKMLSMTGKDNSIEAEDKKKNIDRLKDLVKLAWADGELSHNEEKVIFQKSKEFGIAEDKIKAIIKDYSVSKAPGNKFELVKDYDENLSDYYNEENKSFDIRSFFKKIASLSPENPNLIKYREDLLSMYEHNNDGWLQRARLWEKIYDESSRETEWREAKNNMDECLDALENGKELYDHIYSLKKSELIAFAESVSEEDPDDWN